MGAWIETILLDLRPMFTDGSYPVWVRGLKLSINFEYVITYEVVPRVGAWIETQPNRIHLKAKHGRTPCGCVD